jgi:S1-C subfamily serine protease
MDSRNRCRRIAGRGRIAPRRIKAGLAAMVVAVVGFFLSADPVAASPGVREAMVKIYSVQIEPYYYDPWSMNRPSASGGSGCVIAGNRILTNAHIVSDQSFIQVRRHGDSKKYTARVIAVSHTADLALLTVDTPEFFEAVEPLQLGDLPEVQQEVTVYGFPEGGDTLSITKGVVSRVEHDAYAHSSFNLLAVQIDAAINPGNSGGPVLADDRVSGVVMQYLEDSENIGYMVPAPLIHHFLDDLKDGRYDGIPEDGIVVQPMENDALKDRFGLPRQRSGSLVVTVLPDAPAQGAVRPGDVILAVDGHAVADDGTIEFRPRERTLAAYFTQMHQIGDDLDLTLWRDGGQKTVRIRLDKALGSLDLVPKERYDVRPTYYIYGGLIFVPLTQNYLMSWGEQWYSTAPKNLVALYDGDRRTVSGEEVVVLSKVLPAEVNNGYHQYRDLRVVEVNHRRIRNLNELMAAVEGAGAERFVEFGTEDGLRIVLNRQRVVQTQAQLLRTYSVPSDRSEDLSGGETLRLTERQ